MRRRCCGFAYRVVGEAAGVHVERFCEATHLTCIAGRPSALARLADVLVIAVVAQQMPALEYKRVAD